MTMLPTMLAGANYVMHAAGWLESGLVSCFEKFVVDVEILRMLEVEFTPLEISEETLAFSAHEEVGAGGHFLGAVHTLERFRECFYRPLLSSTSNYERWAARRRQGCGGAGDRDLQADARGVRRAGARAGAEGGAEGLRRPPPHRARRLRPAGCRCSSTAPGSTRPRARRSRATSPATGEAIGEVPQGGRGDARAAIARRPGVPAAGPGRRAFERAAALHRVADAVERRRDELARMLTLDQGKPLHAEAYDEVDELVAYWRNAAEDGKRLEGRLPSSVSPGKRVLLVRRPRGVVGVITPWNWPYTMPAELIAPALACGNTVVWTPAPTTSRRGGRTRRVRRRGRPAGRGVQPGDRPGAGRRRRDRPQPRHPGGRLHRLDGDRAQGRRGGGRQGVRARARRQRAGRRARRRRPRRRSRGGGDRLLPLRRPELHRGRAAARPSRRPRGVRRAARRGSSPSACGSATRSPRGRRSGR